MPAFDVPRTTDTPHCERRHDDREDHEDREAWIMALLVALRGQDFVADAVTPLRLRVSHPRTPGIELDITCRRRASDGGRFWFLGRDDRPLAPADQLQDAIVAIKGQTAVRL